jgi:hypothetical protein
MQRTPDIELTFPIKDAASPALMVVKADCLRKAGIINEADKRGVYSRARTFLDNATLKDAALSHLIKTSAATSRRHRGGACGARLARPSWWWSAVSPLFH